MGVAVITVKIMPESPETDLEAIKTEALAIIKELAGNGETREKIEPVAFGLKSLNITFVMNEEKGNPDAISEKIAEVEGVNSAEISDVRRAIG